MNLIVNYCDYSSNKMTNECRQPFKMLQSAWRLSEYDMDTSNSEWKYTQNIYTFKWNEWPFSSSSIATTKHETRNEIFVCCFVCRQITVSELLRFSTIFLLTQNVCGMRVYDAKEAGWFSVLLA